MYTNHEWCILIFQLEYHTYYDTFKHIHFGSTPNVISLNEIVS
jgi:hypothetical protein